ncbi:hypothetical protein [Alkalihalophilus marmarensis]|uniref:hypothetical protein n=1 Tax=Alkalihalophilus marmarensis TaxID=521377 RepID=UPI002DBB40A5|nr:hypothetical protein [Alkalihalophilus marmarensis]MEC2074268.1 hypothetical protein [Alkalihalophilus marmarensis]
MELKLNQFYSFSSSITGFHLNELKETGLGKCYLNVILKNEPSFVYEIAKFNQGNCNLIYDKYKNTINKIIMLWYTGCWYKSKNDFYVVNEKSYINGLMWKALDTHTLGANAQGYGYWSKSPVTNEEEL